MQAKSIAECFKRIMQYFQPLLSYNLSFRSMFCLFLSGCFTQVLLYCYQSAGHIATGNLEVLLILEFSLLSLKELNTGFHLNRLHQLS